MITGLFYRWYRSGVELRIAKLRRQVHNRAADMRSLAALAMGNEQMTWVVYALAGITVLYIVLRPWLRRQKDPLAGLPSIGLAQQRQVERDMQNLLVELSEMARQISAQLDTRAAKLEALIDDADKRIEQLRRLAAPARGGDVVAGSGSGDGRDQPEAAAKPAGEPPADERYREVYELADAGMTAAEISRRLNRPQGEIELILALRRPGGRIGPAPER